MLKYIHPLNRSSAENAGYGDVGANRLMPLNLLFQRFRLACPIRLALDRCKLACFIMTGDIHVLQNLSAAVSVVSTFELQLLKLLLDIFFYAEELGLVTLHGAHARFVMELF